MRGGSGTYSRWTGVDQSFAIWDGRSGSLEGFELELGAQPGPGLRRLEIAGIVGFLSARWSGLRTCVSTEDLAAMYRRVRQDAKLLFLAGFLWIGFIRHDCG